MATARHTLVALLLGVLAVGSQAAISSHAHVADFRESAAKRGSDLARAPDGSMATDAPLPTIHAHKGVRSYVDDDPPKASSTTSTSSLPSLSTQSDSEASAPSVSLWLLLAMTMVMALLSGVGALPYLFTGKLDPYWSGIANAVGCGVMLAASFDLLEESKTYSATLVLGGILLGVLAMYYSQTWLSRFEDVSFSDLQGADARKAMLIIGVMAAHAFGEGSGVGVSFSGPRGWAQGLLVTIAIGLHNIPEGMAVATIMVARGTPPRTALFWTLLSALPQGIVAVPSYMFVETFSSLLPIALGFAAGCMIWIVFAELIPDALEAAEHSHVATAATLSAAALQYISMVIAKLERPDGTVASPIAADLTQLLPDLAVLSPGLLLAPCAAAGLAGSLLPSLPLTMGMSVGVGTWAGLAGLLSGLARQQHHADRHLGLLWAAAGAAAAAGLWRALAAVAGPAPQHAVRKDSGGGGGVELELGLGEGKAEAGILVDTYRGVHHLTGSNPQHPKEHPLLPPHYGAGNGLAAGPAPLANGWAAAVGPCGEVPAAAAGVLPPGPYYSGSGGGGMMNGVGPGAVCGGGGVSMVHVTGVAAVGRGSGAGQAVERRGGHGAATAGGAPQEGGGGGGWGPGPLLHCQGSCSCKECGAKAGHWGAPMDLLPGLDRPRECVRAALLVGAMLLVGELPTAYDVAGGLLRRTGDVSSLLPPLALRGIALGVASVGVARAVAGSPGWRLPATAAGLFAAALTSAVAALLLPLPLGRAPAEDIPFDAAHAAVRLRAFASGGLLLAAVGYLWPAAAHFKPRKVQLGVSMGLGLGAVLALANAALCAGTPYCLSPQLR